MGYYDGKKNNRFPFMMFLCLILAGTMLYGGIALATDHANFFQASSKTKAVEEAIADANTPEEEQVSELNEAYVRPNNISDIAEKAVPAVVRIETVVTTQESDEVSPFFDDPMFRQFFGVPEQSQPRQRQGLGSGFIISEDGYILTNQHVIDQADEIYVTVTGREEPYRAELIGSDEMLDLAVLKIDPEEELTTLKLGDSEAADVGDWMIAIGNPYGLDHTVTVGVLSAKGRPLALEGHQFKNLLQTDASINHGNSGGPLLNLKGEVIGINTAINAQAQGIGFAIPSNTVKEVLQQLIEEGKVIRPWVGVSIQDVTQQIAEYYQLEEAKGTVVAEVLPGTPAESAGLQRGDVILEVNEQPVEDAQDFINKIQETQVGDNVMLLVHREGGARLIGVTVGERPASID